MPESQISLFKLVQSTRKLINLLLNRKLLILIFASATGTSAAIFNLLQKRDYVAKLSIMLEGANKPGGTFANYMTVAVQMGLANAPAITQDRLVDLFKSNRIIGNSLLTYMNIGDQKVSLANHMLEFTGIGTDLKDDPALINFSFLGENIDQLSFAERKVISILTNRVRKEYLRSDAELSGFITIRVTSNSELFSMHLAESLVKEVSAFYIGNITRKETTTVEVMQKASDSLDVVLKLTEEGYAVWKDKSHHLVKAQGQLQEIEYITDLTVLRELYIDAQKNLVLAKFNLLHGTPIIQIIDRPRLPLPIKEASPLIGFLLFAALGGVMISFYLVLREVVMNALKAEELESSNVDSNEYN